nr:Putative 5-3 exonuclease domain containing protein [Haemonchus contortus]
MGVPAFFRWLTRKYPSIIVNANEERQRNADGTKIPIDATKPNPNFQEFDNLYLDMNGIIHPCTHPEDRPAPANEDEMFALIFEYIDRIFSIVRPRKLLYMAIDGVAPRAKMNQQRSRRFRASKEAWEKAESIEEQRRRLEEEGVPLPPRKTDEAHFDSNCITPGTPFMARLAEVLRYYIHDRITTDPAWAKIQVILSDANAPGEGEHKIMDFIRKQRSNPAHNPDTVHCLCGADADLIMLGLATHEANFNIIREEFIPNQQRPCDLCGQYGHELKECRGLENEEKGPEHADPISKEKNFIFLRIPVLREYLERDMAMENLPFKYDFERVIDDWVFLCFFVGNDFLPHLPSLEIREGAIDRLIKLYKDMVYTMKGYLTKDGNVYMDRVERIMLGLGEVEDEIFKRRQQDEERFKAIQKAKKARMSGGRPQAPSYVPREGSLIAPLSRATPMSGETTRALAATARQEAMQFAQNEEAARRMKLMLKEEGTNSDVGANQGNRKRKSEGPIDLDDEEPKDEVRLFEAGWKDRYYRAKFDVGADDVDFRRKVAWAYVEGLCWVLKYYYQGCVSWDWYFPYHYAPFASDFDTVSQFKPDFSKPTKPFKPLEQLMSVFPAASKQHLPLHWQKLMTDEDSPIIDLYPTDFRIDLNGKKFAWQGVALLPFVDEVRLLRTLETVQDTLTEEEKARNTTGPNRIFIGKKHPAFDFFKELYSNVNGEVNSVDIDPAFTYGMSGRITADKTALAPDLPFPSPVNDKSCPDLPVNGAMMVIYEDPHYPEGFIFPAKRLENAKEIPRALRDYSDRRGGNDYRPQIGFTRDVPQRASLDSSAHRFVQHNVRYDNRDYDNNRNNDGGRGRGYDRGGGGYQGGGYNRGGYGSQNGSYVARGGGGMYQNPYGPNRGGYDRGYNGPQARGFSSSSYGNQAPGRGYGGVDPRGRGGTYNGSSGPLPWHRQS